jgi:flagellar biosynthetic protein FlhB
MERLLSYRLQFFAEGSGGEKTEDATSKKLSDARGEGQVAKSTDLITASALLGLFFVLKTFVGTIGNSFINIFVKTYNSIDIYTHNDFNQATAQQVLRDNIVEIIKISTPVFISAFVIAFVTNLFQVKWKLTGKPLMPKFNKFNPISGFKKMFSKDKLVELLKEVIKIGVIVYVANNTLVKNKDLLSKLYDMDLIPAILLIGNIVINLGYKISIIFLFIGFADYIYQKFKFRKDMKMTKQEVKDEYKQAEGDPQIKGKIRAKMREASQRRMMQQLPEADVVITNPTHFAAAIKYDKEASEAPILIAKGADYLAQKIKEAARENNIQIVENKPLARMLYYNVEIGNEIPPELYQMTAEVLAYVYNLNNQHA